MAGECQHLLLFRRAIEQNSIVHSNLSTDAIRPPRKSGSEAAYRPATYARGGAKIFTTDVSSLMLITWFVCLILWTNYQILIKYPYLIFYALFRVLPYCSMDFHRSWCKCITKSANKRTNFFRFKIYSVCWLRIVKLLYFGIFLIIVFFLILLFFLEIII